MHILCHYAITETPLVGRKETVMSRDTRGARRIGGALMRAYRTIKQIKQELEKYKKLARRLFNLILVKNDEVARLAEQVARMQDEMAHLRVEASQAYVDALTGLPNRLAYNSAIRREVDRAHRNPEHRLVMTVVDIDHFKRVNDEFGHPVGDKVITTVGQILREGLRKVDFVGRVGGEEFVLIMPGIDHNDAERLLTFLRVAIEEGVSLRLNLPRPVTASFGAAVFRSSDTAEVMYEVADKALYAAKRERNQVVIVT